MDASNPITTALILGVTAARQTTGTRMGEWHWSHPLRLVSARPHAPTVRFTRVGA